MTKLNELDSRFDALDEGLWDEFSGISKEHQKLREAHQALKAEIDTIPEDIAKLSEVIFRDLLEEHDVTDIHAADSERLQVTLNSLAKTVREQHASGAATIQSIHDQLNVLKDSVAGIESRLTSVARDLQEPTDTATAPSSSAKQSVVYGLLHDILSPLGKTSKPAEDSVEKEGLGSKKSNNRGSSVKKQASKRGKGGPVLMYSPDGSLDTASRDSVEPATEKTASLTDETAGQRQTEGQSDWTEKENSETTAAATPAVPPAFPTEPVGGGEPEVAQPAPGEEAATPREEGQTPANTATSHDAVPPHIQAEGESASKAADAEELASLLHGPIKRYGMVDPEEKATIYRE
jgi:hypothetical protein